MGELIDDLLTLSRLGRKEMALSGIDMDELAKAVIEELSTTAPGRVLQFNIKTLPFAYGDSGNDSVGFDMQYSNKLFGVFQRLHSDNEIEGDRRRTCHCLAYYSQTWWKNLGIWKS